MERLLLRAIVAGILGVAFLGLVASLYWQFVKGFKPCPYCQAIRLAYLSALLGLPAALAKWGPDALFWSALGWAGLTSVLSALPFITECVPCFEREGVPFIGPLSAYHLALIGAGAVALLASFGLLLPQRADRKL